MPREAPELAAVWALAGAGGAVGAGAGCPGPSPPQAARARSKSMQPPPTRTFRRPLMLLTLPLRAPECGRTDQAASGREARDATIEMSRAAVSRHRSQPLPQRRSARETHKVAFQARCFHGVPGRPIPAGPMAPGGNAAGKPPQPNARHAGGVRRQLRLTSAGGGLDSAPGSCVRLASAAPTPAPRRRSRLGTNGVDRSLDFGIR